MTAKAWDLLPDEAGQIRQNCGRSLFGGIARKKLAASQASPDFFNDFGADFRDFVQSADERRGL